MKKLCLISIFLFLFIPNVFAKEEVYLKKCVDGDTAWFYNNNEEIKVRFLAIDSPESTNKIEEYGKESSEFTCNELSNAKKIEIEYDENSDKVDKYSRVLAWVFVDNELLNEKIVKNGYAKVKYLYNDYKYTNKIKSAENYAKLNKLGVWNTNTNDINNYNLIIVCTILVICIILSFFLKKKSLKKINKKIIKKLSSEYLKK